MKVAEYMTAAATAQTAKPDTTLQDIATQLTEHNCSCVVILEGEKPVGKKYGYPLQMLHFELRSSNLSGI